MKSRSHFLSTFVVAAVSGVLTARMAWAGTEKVLHAFSITDGERPSGVVFDGAGNLYGTAFYGGGRGCGGSGCGVVFKLTPEADGDWSESTVYTFRGAADGSHPDSTLIFDAAGNLYGTTFGAYYGGTGHGTAFKLTASANGSWSFALLHTFAAGKDGAQPSGSLVLDSSGNLYGTTFVGGSYDAGVAFELSPTVSGEWKETLLHTFTGGLDGYGPSGLTMDAKGNIYGATPYGGSAVGCNSCGVVYALSNSAGAWTEKVLRRFTGGIDGGVPSSLLFDSSGNLYGTTQVGGNTAYCPGGCGLVFELAPGSGEEWKETVLHNFNGGNGDDAGGLIFDSSGNLYGSAYIGGYGPGLVFSLASDASWAETVIFEFDGTDGLEPSGPLVLDQAGNLYGTTVLGGASDDGVVFEVTP